MEFLWSLHALRAPALTAFFSFVTFLGDEIVVVGLLCALYWCINKELAFGVSVSFFVSALIVQGLKIALRIERPWLLDPSFDPVTQAVSAATGYSFPSGHTQAAAALFGYLGIASGKKRWAAAAWGLVLLVGLSRMYLGVHTPLDVIGSLIITLVVILATRVVLRGGRSDAAVATALVALSAVVIAYALHLHRQGVIETHYLSDCCKAAGGCIGCAAGFLWARKRIPFETATQKIWMQLLKFAVGAVGLLFFKSGLKAIWGESLLLDTLRYFLVALWALALYPMLFARFLPPVGAPLSK